ncbi:MAG TPA: cytochrome c3 family protein [Acidobacteriota bacterium]|nr:cytochrome c3 family protein [Acidobacteriota bacterium]
MKGYRNLVIAAFLLIGIGARAQAEVNVDEPAICLSCHADFKDVYNESHVHSVLKSGKCSDCHNPHAARHATLLSEDLRELCLTCHDDVAQAAARARGHEPAAIGNCLSCHDPHASAHPDQLLQPAGELCSGCHTTIDEWRSRAHVHAPFGNRKCLSCHDPHGSDNPGLTADGIPALCFDCHDNDAALRQAHQGYQIAGTNCLACHDPHSSSLANLVMPNEHAPFKGNNCSTCHATGAGGSGFGLVSDVKTLCFRCHASIRTEADQAFSHNLNDERSCLNCHNPHAAAGTALLSAKQEMLCLNCHFKGSEYAGKSRTSLLTHDAMECTTCHQPHGSDNGRYLISTDSDLCAGCHERAHRSTHPIGPDVIDQRTGKPLTCMSCHQLHGADFEPYLPLNPKMDLCIQCHRT